MKIGVRRMKRETTGRRIAKPFFNAPQERSQSKISLPKLKTLEEPWEDFKRRMQNVQP